MSKAQIPSPFSIEIHKNEWTCSAKVAEWINEIVEKNHFEFGKAEVETTVEGNKKRADVVLCESPGSTRALCVIEFKIPQWDPFDDELKDHARKKAVKRQTKYFCTSNFKLLIWFNTQRVNEGLPDEAQIHEKYHLSDIEDLDLIEEYRFKKTIQDGI